MRQSYRDERHFNHKALVYLAALVITVCGGASQAAPKNAFMTLGEAAFAPIGYVQFCGRRPDQCAASPRLMAKVGAPQGSAARAASGGELAVPGALQDEGAAFDDADGRLTAQKISFGGAANAPVRRPQLKPAPAAEPEGPVAYTPALMALLNETNRRINHDIRPETDMQSHGVADYWDLPLDANGIRAGDCEDYVLQKREALAKDGLPVDDLSIAIVRTHRGETHAVLVVTTDQGEYVLDNMSPWVTPWRDVNYTWVERQAPGHGPFDWVSLEADNAAGR